MAEATAKPASNRPLSPHLQIYRWSWTMAMSVFHRLTGSALYAGTLLVAWWLVAMATGPDAYETVRSAMGSIPGRIVMIGYTWALLHHMLGGLRHLVWDTGIGYGPAARMNLARGTLIGSAVLTVLVWVLALTFG